MKDNFTLKLLKYWRNSLADAEKADINKLEEKVKSGEAIKIPNSELPNGQINAELASKLISSQKDRDNHKWNGYE
ncbi:MAG: hypothetical protein J2P31_04725, partial [Blastocatellia bacterium]|nr:hypothetical protein [Blastocatellia bacterium]